MVSSPLSSTSCSQPPRRETAQSWLGLYCVPSHQTRQRTPPSLLCTVHWITPLHSSLLLLCIRVFCETFTSRSPKGSSPVHVRRFRYRFDLSPTVMLLTSKLLNLPASILFLITAHTTIALQNDRLANNFPENARRIARSPDQRDVEARDEPTPLGRTPVGVMKMSDDPSQKFYMHYWGYEDDLPESNPSDIPPARLLRPRDEDEEALLLANSSAAISYRAPFALHTDEIFGLRHLESRGRMSGRDAAGAALAALQKRQFECPSGTSACTSIGYPNSCCATDETCFKIQDTGLGPVGCCPSGDTCGGTISGCNSPNTPCAENEGGNYEGGGCCIPNYVCAGIGCKFCAELSSWLNFSDLCVQVSLLHQHRVR